MTEAPKFMDLADHERTPEGQQHGPHNCPRCRTETSPADRQFRTMMTNRWTVSTTVTAEEIAAWLNEGEDDPRFIRAPDTVGPVDVLDYLAAVDQGNHVRPPASPRNLTRVASPLGYVTVV
jgi:hypothetical protein